MATKAYAWDGIREDLEVIASHHPDFLPNTVLVGGAACWYYRMALSRVRDPDFIVPRYSPEEESIWLSKDLDFMGESDEEISELLGQPCPAMGTLVQFAGATIDFIAEGLRMTRQAAHASARKAQIGNLSFYLASPGMLFVEKSACVAQKNRPQDPIHREVLARFIKMELCRGLESPEELETKSWLTEAKQVKSVDIRFFSSDLPLQERLHRAAPGLGIEHRAIVHWIHHHVPKADDGGK